MTWIGRKKLAFVPLYRTNAEPPDQIPPDWPDQILRRALFDKDPVTGTDRSLRAYIHTVSSGLADLDAVVQPMVTIAGQDIPPNALEGQMGAQLRNEGFDAAAIVMLGGAGAGTNAGFWSRFVMVEQVGVWAMEFIHGLANFGDLYPFGGNMGAFDEMACSCGTHPSAYTKAAVGWIDRFTIALHVGRYGNYTLHSIGLVQPPPSGRVAAVQVGSQVPYLMIEARQKVDQFDANINSEGVIVYRVQTDNPLGWAEGAAPVVLLTTTALAAGQTFTTDNGVTVQVNTALPGGFSITVDDPTNPVTIVPDVIQRYAHDALIRIEAAGLVAHFDKPSTQTSWVYSQSPPAGDVVAAGSTVNMVLHTGPLPEMSSCELTIDFVSGDGRNPAHEDEV